MLPIRSKMTAFNTKLDANTRPTKNIEPRIATVAPTLPVKSELRSNFEGR